MVDRRCCDEPWNDFRRNLAHYRYEGNGIHAGNWRVGTFLEWIVHQPFYRSQMLMTEWQQSTYSWNLTPFSSDARWTDVVHPVPIWRKILSANADILCHTAKQKLCQMIWTVHTLSWYTPSGETAPSESTGNPLNQFSNMHHTYALYMAVRRDGIDYENFKLLTWYSVVCFQTS